MLFSSITFLYYFLPAVLILYFLSPKSLKNIVLLLANLVFYGWGEPKYLFLMIGSIVLFYCSGLAIGKSREQKRNKLWLIFSIIVSIALLGIFKYADFFIENINSVTGMSIPFLRLALPIGISFYTFQCLSYVIDVYRGNAEVQKNFINFALYVSLFPQLIAGPIVRYTDISREIESRTHSWNQAAHGLRRFLTGLAKKILIADNLALLINIFHESGEQSVVFYWMYAIGFMLNIYFDFSGYSCMAIGLGEILGFHFPENFNYPYISKSISEFWRRWHISLGLWFRDYVYIPLGGNRVKTGRWIFNILVVWALTGMWHGASWNFILWGLFYAAFLVLEKWAPALKQIPDFMQHIYVLFVIMTGFILFNASDVLEAGEYIKCIFGFGGLPFITAETMYYLKSYAIIFVIAMIGSTPVTKKFADRLYAGEKTGKIMDIAEPVFLIMLLLICTGYLVDGSFSPFLYFRF